MKTFIHFTVLEVPEMCVTKATVLGIHREIVTPYAIVSD